MGLFILGYVVAAESQSVQAVVQYLKDANVREEPRGRTALAQTLIDIYSSVAAEPTA